MHRVRKRLLINIFYSPSHARALTMEELLRRVAVVSGFLGLSPDKQITTLGRGGSDLTATIIGVAMGVDEVQVCYSVTTRWLISVLWLYVQR